MKKLIILAALAIASCSAPGQTRFKDHADKTDTASTGKYKAGQMVRVYDRTYTILAAYHWPDHRSDIFYDCVDARGEIWMRLPERSIKSSAQ